MGGDIICDGGAGCEKSVITTSNSLYCLGLWACGFNTEIHARTVYCTGSGACREANIHSHGELDVYVTSAGQWNAKVYCHDEDTCNIHCTLEPDVKWMAHGFCPAVYCDGNCNVVCDGQMGCPPIYYEGLCYYISGNPAIIHGDPHTTTFAGIVHDFQGQPQNGGLDQYYYMYPCHGFDHEAMPFHLIGRHYGDFNPKISGLDYLVLELFVGDGEVYVIFINPSIHSYAMALDGVDNTNYDNMKNDNALQQLVS